jgi:hypothetical protein
LLDNTSSYVVGIGLRKRPAQVIEHLLSVNDKLNELKESGTSVLELIPCEVMLADKAFMDYVKSANIKFIRDQIAAFQLLFKFIK